MGLDQYAYAVSKRSVGTKQVDHKLSDRVKREQLGDWRNHRHLLKWMAKLYYEKGGKKGPKKGWCIGFLRLDERDLDKLERAVEKKKLYGYVFNPRTPSPKTGSPDLEFDSCCLAWDKEFLEKARTAIAAGKVVFYKDWW